jgi:hypothetical protein
MVEIGAMEYAAERNTTRSHMGGGKVWPKACRQRKEILEERITLACMEVLIRETSGSGWRGPQG